MNTAVIKLDSLTLDGIRAELVPSPDWRERAKRGRKSMFYSVSGRATVDGKPARVEVNIDAVTRENKLSKLGLEMQDARGTVLRHLANRGEKDHTAKVKSAAGDRPDTIVPVYLDGKPEWDEDAILITDGEDRGSLFDLRYGARYLVNTDRGLTVKLGECELTAEATSSRGETCYRARTAGYEIVRALRAHASGAVCDDPFADAAPCNTSTQTAAGRAAARAAKAEQSDGSLPS